MGWAWYDSSSADEISGLLAAIGIPVSKNKDEVQKTKTR